MTHVGDVMLCILFRAGGSGTQNFTNVRAVPGYISSYKICDSRVALLEQCLHTVQLVKHFIFSILKPLCIPYENMATNPIIEEYSNFPVH
jgi:hypothetical protein